MHPLWLFSLSTTRTADRFWEPRFYGEDGVDKRIDVLSTAVSAGMTVEDLGELDLAYAPPFGSANDPVNMAGFAAENRLSGYSPAILPAEVEAFIENKKLALIDIRDYFSFQKGHIQGSVNLAAEKVLDELAQVPSDTTVLIVDDNGKTAHRLVRQLLMAGYENSLYVSGGYPGFEYLGRAGGLNFLQLPLPAPDEKSLETLEESGSDDAAENAAVADDGGHLIVDVRTPEEYAMGAYPEAVNIPLDELPGRLEELGSNDREITVYCASGARSAYAARIIEQQGLQQGPQRRRADADDGRLIAFLFFLVPGWSFHPGFFYAVYLYESSICLT